MSTSTSAPARTSTFASLKVRNYKLFFYGGLLSNTGTWMGRVAQTWLVLTILTDNSATAVGYLAALQFLPMALLGPWGGAVADRFPKRTILIWTQVFLSINAGILALLVLTNTTELWHVYALALMLGAISAVDNPTRQAFASAMVINAVSFLPVIIALVAMNPAELTPAPLRRGRGAVREGLRYVAGRPDIQLIMFIVFMLGTFGMNFQITNALMATEVYDVGADAYGALGSIMAIGSLSAALMAARRPRPRLSMLLGALGGFAVSTTLLALAPTYLTFAIMLVPVGLTALTVMTTANASVQLTTEPAVRGRVMALYMTIFLGGTPLGSPVIGWIGDAWGARWTLLIGGIATGIAFAVGMFYALRNNDWRLPSWRELRGYPDPVPLDADEAPAR